MGGLISPPYGELYRLDAAVVVVMSESSVTRKGSDVSKEYLEKLREAVLRGDMDTATEASTFLSRQGLAPVEIVNRAIKPAMDEIGKKYERLEAFLPELIVAGDAAQEALKILLPREGGQGLIKGKVVIGTIYGDIHDIGKNITAAILGANGYQIVDLGNDVHPDRFVDTAKSEEANILGISCLLSPSMFYMRDVIRRLKDEGIREKFYVGVGGAAVYPEWAKEIEADGWAKDAERAVQLCDILVEKGRELPKPVILGEWR